MALTMSAQTKLVDDGLAPNGSTIPATAFTIDWETQKIVANLDMSAEDGINANTMSFSDNETDLAEWDVKNGYSLHFYYTNAASVWTTNNKNEYLTHCFTIQLRNSADLTTTPTVYVNNVADPSNVSIEITKDGVYVDGELKMAASEIEAFYSKTDLYFGSLQGDNRSKAVYKSLEVQTIDNGGGENPEPEIEGTVVEGSKDFAAGGNEFEWSDVAIDWDKQKLVAVLDLSTCGDNTQNENILSVGENIGEWKIGGWHFYYTKSTGRMKVDYLTTGGSHPLSTAKTDVSADNEIRIEISKENGVTINGEAYLDNYDSSVTGTWQENTADFWNLVKLNIGSKEGANRSNATIKYVTVVDLQTETPEPPVTEDGGLIEAGYQPAGAAWSKSTTIDWDKQYVKAVIDLSTCKNTFENILSVGESISEWASAPHYHFYYTASSKSLQFNGMNPDNKSRYDITLDSDELTIEISKKKGLVINGTQYLNQYDTANQYASIEDYLTALSTFFALTDIEFGGCQGETFSNATYKYFNVLDLPEDPSTGINNINAEIKAGNAEIYTVGGVKVKTLQKGINIVRLANGKTVKVLK